MAHECSDERLRRRAFSDMRVRFAHDGHGVEFVFPELAQMVSNGETVRI
jgi:hypothetical protein